MPFPYHVMCVAHFVQLFFGRMRDFPSQHPAILLSNQREHICQRGARRVTTKCLPQIIEMAICYQIPAPEHRNGHFSPYRSQIEDVSLANKGTAWWALSRLQADLRVCGLTWASAHAGLTITASRWARFFRLGRIWASKPGPRTVVNLWES